MPRPNRPQPFRALTSTAICFAAFVALWTTTPMRAEDQAASADSQRLPAEIAVTSNDLSVVFRRTDDGIRLAQFSDQAAKRDLLAAKPSPLFVIVLREANSHEEVRLLADTGWQHVQFSKPDASGIVELRWEQPKDHRLGALRVVARLASDQGALRWKLAVDSQSSPWSVWRVTFPQVDLVDLGPQAKVFYPRGCGQVESGVWQREFRWRDKYPGGWTGMQFMAAYNESGKTGLYAATHDPLACPKELFLESRPAEHALTMGFEHPVPDMGKAGNRFELSGEAVWQLLRGDWFDAATTYRDWVRKQARWYPQLTPEGRADTPPWMRELPVWVMTGGSPAECEKAVAEFAQTMQVPVGFHWYRWHAIPFDNDYPHYFPTQDGIAPAVARLQAAGVYVMPYINGRLWDTRDKGTEDFQFSRLAMPATTKDEQGKPVIESYGSKEADDTPVRLAVMCPTTAFWQDRVRDIVGRLFGEVGVKGVYIDQVAAATPVLCFDPAHQHPLGGGSWWPAGYWQMLDAIRQAKPADRMLTTECNAEPYVKWFDGYLTWHWQYDGQVPAFPAVYGGAIQMFGRAYRAGETKHLALRMKAAQQLVFGEQIGWFDPTVIRETDSAEFLRQVVPLRWRLRRYFYAGEMGRPPKLEGEIPKVTADWQWSGVWPVTTDALLSGAWLLPNDGRAVLLFANVSDQPLAVRLRLDAVQYGLPAQQLRMTAITAAGPGESVLIPPSGDRELKLAPRSAMAWELSRP